MRFILEGSNNLADWTTLGSSGQWIVATTWLYSTDYYRTPVKRDNMVEFKMFMPIGAVTYLATWTAAILLCVGIFMVAEGNRSRNVGVGMLIGYSLVALTRVPAGIDSAIHGDAITAFYQFFFSACYFWISSGIYIYEPLFDLFLTLATLLLILDQVFVYLAKNAGDQLRHADNLFLMLTMLINTVAGTIFIRIHRTILMQAVMDLELDKDTYELEWHALIAEEGTQESLQSLQKTVNGMQQKLRPKDGRQYNSVPSRAATLAASFLQQMDPLQTSLPTQEPATGIALPGPGVVPRGVPDGIRTVLPGIQESPGSWRFAEDLTKLLHRRSSPRHPFASHLTSGNNSPGNRSPISARSMGLNRKGHNVLSSTLDRSTHTPTEAAHTYAIDKSAPVDSLDQLYAQACLLMPVLRAKTLEWAGACRGMMRQARRASIVKVDAHLYDHMGVSESLSACSEHAHDDDMRIVEQPSHVKKTKHVQYGDVEGPWEDVHTHKIMSVVAGSSPSKSSSRETDSEEDDSSELTLVPCDGSVPLEHIRAPKLKSAGRCVDKADIAYRGNVSRMMDICRESVYFDTVRDLHACLEMISADESIDIVRVKSTMSTSYSNKALSFSGYRYLYVCMYVCICM